MVSLLHKELEDKVHESGEAHEQEGWRLEVGGWRLEVMQPSKEMKSELQKGKYIIPDQSTRSFTVAID